MRTSRLASFASPAMSARVLLLALFAAVLLVLVAPGCGRSSLEPETLTSADGGPVGNCGPSTCPTGCCDSQGICRVGSDTRACGSAGGRCSDCIAQGFNDCSPTAHVCGRDEPQCGPSTCPTGCCSFEGGRARCLSGTEGAACGRGGGACTDCAGQGRSCDTRTRACSAGRCDASNCDGCCVGNQCLPGTDSLACGTKGEQCDSCASMGQSCQQTPGGGGQCQGTPTCNRNNCPNGCCRGNQCVAGTDSTACGTNGATCQSCSTQNPARVCVADGQPNARTCQLPQTCNAATCAGCCVGNECVIATTPQACGRDGAACRACGANETCNAGACQPAPPCGPGNCDGCCIGDICATGSQNTACGLSGAQCQNCTGNGRVCQGGTCQTPACGPASGCLGCCAGNTCVVGTQDNACGPATGAQCSDCTANDRVCANRACAVKCSPLSCNGCCQANNSCALGFANGACGSGGAACTNCTGQGATCNTLELPRVCSNQPGDCPAPYNTCADGLVTPVTPSIQQLCADAGELDAIAAACSLGATQPSCVAALATLAGTNKPCSDCLAPFAVPWVDLTGVYRCVAPFVDGTCNHATACASDCGDKSCVGCAAGNRAQCRLQVNGNGGQCNGFVGGTICVGPAIVNGQLCSPDTYGQNYGQWLRGVGNHFCGFGP